MAIGRGDPVGMWTEVTDVVAAERDMLRKEMIVARALEMLVGIARRIVPGFESLVDENGELIAGALSSVDLQVTD